jgi:hypothetical protein
MSCIWGRDVRPRPLGLCRRRRCEDDDPGGRSPLTRGRRSKVTSWPRSSRSCAKPRRTCRLTNPIHSMMIRLADSSSTTPGRGSPFCGALWASLSAVRTSRSGLNGIEHWESGLKNLDDLDDLGRCEWLRGTPIFTGLGRLSTIWKTLFNSRDKTVSVSGRSCAQSIATAGQLPAAWIVPGARLKGQRGATKCRAALSSGCSENPPKNGSLKP